MALNKKARGIAGRILVLVIVAAFNSFACWNIWSIPWGKGFNGSLSYKWALVFIMVVGTGFASLLMIWRALWYPQQLKLWTSRWLAWRKPLGIARWVIGILLACVPALILQFTYFGILLTSPIFRLWLWAVAATLIGILFTSKQESTLDWQSFLGGLLATGSAFTIVSAFRNVTSYPFSLFWSEGNRFWDYSILLGRRLYDYPTDLPIFAYIDLGRQITWGLPFLLPHWSITMMRGWDGFVNTVPYAVLGWLAFQTRQGNKKILFLLGLWAYLFLNQGPVYTPLVLCAILVAVSWKRPLWLALPLMAIAGYFAQLSRWIWIFAPAIWAAMLELNILPSKSKDEQLPARAWLRAITMASAALIGKNLISFLLYLWQLIARGGTTTASMITSVLFNVTAPLTGGLFLARLSLAAGNINALIAGLLVVCFLLAFVLLAFQIRRSQKLTHRQKLVSFWLLMGFFLIGCVVVLKFMGPWLDNLASIINKQPLLWYRLLPNSTFWPGILLGLFIACSPLAALLIYSRVLRLWRLSFWQHIVILVAITAFLGVGLVASVKIGGGGDLHNLDMFFVGMLFVAALAWRNAKLEEWVISPRVHPVWNRILILVMIIVPVIQPLLNIRPLLSSETYQQIKTLTNPSSSIKILPSTERINLIVDIIREQSVEAQSHGEVLFMDQRQLMTFGYIQNIPLVPDYEKKYMMDQALSGNAGYFQAYYRDLAKRRFSLIITEPLNLVSRGDIGSFGNENDAWVKWVSAPTLCLYKPIFTFKDVGVELLIPNPDISACAQYLEP